MIACRVTTGLLLGAIVCTAGAGAQAPESLPFACGERLTFTVRASKFGTIGNATMNVSGPEYVRGVPTMLIEMDTQMGVLFMRGSDANKSWIDPRRMTTLRFRKHQRRPFSSLDDSVEVFPDLHEWVGVRGESGNFPGSDPYDELSFFYLLRTMSFVPDSTYVFENMYDRRRNSSTVRLVKREILHTPAGAFSTEKLEVHLKDGPDWKSDWVLHLWLSEDACRLPVRMESSVPILGSGYLLLVSVVSPTCGEYDSGSLHSRR